jgi:hypothetical protein
MALFGVDTSGVATEALSAKAAPLIGGPLKFWGRYFNGTSARYLSIQDVRERDTSRAGNPGPLPGAANEVCGKPGRRRSACLGKHAWRGQGVRCAIPVEPKSVSDPVARSRAGKHELGIHLGSAILCDLVGHDRRGLCDSRGRHPLSPGGLSKFGGQQAVVAQDKRCMRGRRCLRGRFPGALRAPRPSR